MDPEVRAVLLGKLRAYAARQPRRFDPIGCAYCAATTGLVEGTLCQTCVDLLARLTRAVPAPPPPSSFTPVVRLPFDDGGA